jgi:hypothetical protein
LQHNKRNTNQWIKRCKKRGVAPFFTFISFRKIEKEITESNNQPAIP